MKEWPGCGTSPLRVPVHGTDLPLRSAANSADAAEIADHAEISQGDSCDVGRYDPLHPLTIILAMSQTQTSSANRQTGAMLPDRVGRKAIDAANRQYLADYHFIGPAQLYGNRVNTALEHIADFIREGEKHEDYAPRLLVYTGILLQEMVRQSQSRWDINPCPSRPCTPKLCHPNE